ncbi:MAG TPA: hypothetical protein VFQ27_05975 [Xanthobacteraceae bacterium]|nr:hypothetical protein [Xanthobacteraceae bacterium]
MHQRRSAESEAGEAVSLAEKVAFLSKGEVYPHAAGDVTCRETHMSWVFLAGDRVYKLKKPVRFPYLDFSTLAHRETACRSELHLNRRLARDVYLEVVPLVRTPQGLAVGGRGDVVDWLVVMRRLDESRMLEHLLIHGLLTVPQLESVIEALTDFYRKAAPVLIGPDVFLAEWERSLAYNRRVLLDPKLGLSAGLIRDIDMVQRRFLALRGDAIAARVRRRRIVDGHGDLRPEHIWIGDSVQIIDCIEFNRRLRMVDPFDEVAFLSLECERLGAAWAGAHLARRMQFFLQDGPSAELFIFYRCHRAALRARLAIAHLLEPNPRTPEKWPRLARAYLKIAAEDARRLRPFLSAYRTTCLRR